MPEEEENYQNDKKHDEPFNKRRRGKDRRAERRFALEKRTAYLDCNNHGE